MRATRPIVQPRPPFGALPRQPLADRRLTHAHGGGDGAGAFPAEHAAHDLFSTVWRRPGILVNVHLGLPRCVDG
jgi:hypothetical protein